MPSNETAFQFDDIVVWPVSGVDRYNEPIVGQSYGMKVRYDDSSRRATDSTGKLISVDATMLASEDIPIGSIIWKGHWEDLPVTNPTPLLQVISRNVTDDLRNVESAYDFGMKRYSKTLPAVV